MAWKWRWWLNFLFDRRMSLRVRLSHLSCVKAFMYGGDLWCYHHDIPLVEVCGFHPKS